MIKKVIFTLLALQVFLFAEFQGVNAKEMIELHKNGAAIIDIRTPGEWEQTGVVPGTTKIMFFDEKGNYDVKKFMSEFTKVVKDKNQSFVLICRSSNRTKTVGNFLTDHEGYTNVKELEGGIVRGWLNEGRKTVK